MEFIHSYYPENDRGNMLNDSESFSIIINDKCLSAPKSKLIICSNTVHNEIKIDKTRKSTNFNLNLAHKDSINLISQWVNNGHLDFPNEKQYFRDIFEIGRVLNSEFLTKIFYDYIKDSEINIENFMDIYDSASIQKDDQKANKCIFFFASKMNEFTEDFITKTFKNCGYDFSENVLKSNSLRITSEDSLCNIIISLSKANSKFFELLKYVRVEYCSKNIIEKISNFAEEHGQESISSIVFKNALMHHPRILHKLSLSVTNELHINDKTDQNTRELRSLRKSSDDFDKIYGVLEKAIKDDDFSTIQVAVDEKYTNVYKYGSMIRNAMWSDNLPLVKSLIHFGEDLRNKFIFKGTILHGYCEIGNLDGVKYALNFIDINAKVENNFTPLFIAAIHGHDEICKYLCSQKNIDINARDIFSYTALYYARNHQSTYNLLKSLGCTE